MEVGARGAARGAGGARRIELRQDALEPPGPRRQRVAVPINRRTHQAHDFGVFFGGKIGQGH
jgi:hypothetical protein